MKEYLGMLFGVCAVSAIVRTVAPSGVMKKYIEIVCSLCVICAIASPISQIVFDIINLDSFFETPEGDLVNYDEIYNSYLLGNGLDDAEKTLEEELAERFGCDESCFEVRLGAELSEGEARLRSAAVILSGKAVAKDPAEIKKYVFDRISLECEIIYEKKVEK